MPTLARQQQQSEENGGAGEADRQLHAGRHVGRNRLHRDLLNTPHDTQQQHEQRGAQIQWTTSVHGHGFGQA